MKKDILRFTTVLSSVFLAATVYSSVKKDSPKLPNLPSVLTPIYDLSFSLEEVQPTLESEAPDMNPAVIRKVVTSLKCADKRNVFHNNILTVIDYSLPSNEKRLWVFDLHAQKLLFHTYVSHGIKSGQLQTRVFSNKYDSKASSIGVFTTEKPYYGKEGLSLRLQGHDRGFNDNAANRYIVMHGGWYMDETFIKKYGRPGRSWGCPAVPLDLAGPIIRTVKENSFYVSYYPSDAWFGSSRFLNCEKPARIQSPVAVLPSSLPAIQPQAAILFVDFQNKNRREDTTPVVAMPADKYAGIFHRSPPVDRMIRRQIDHQEYIALSSEEFRSILADTAALSAISFVKPEIKMVRGYYVTEMKVLPMGKIKSAIALSENTPAYALNFEGKPSVHLKSTNQFIRWVGL